MQLPLAILLFSGGLVLLAGSSHFTIKAVEQLIRITRLSEASAGVVILAILTSIPEISVAVFSIFQGSPGFTVGDILGSNVFNIGVVLGLLGAAGLLTTCCTDNLIELTDILFLISLIPIFLLMTNNLSPFVGVGLLAIFFISTWYTSRNRITLVKNEPPLSESHWSRYKILGVLILGFVGVAFAAQIVTSSAIDIVSIFGISPILVGAKIISIGTSLPELTLDLTAARRGHIRMVFGDIIGSNLTNLTLALGIVLISSPFTVDMVVFLEIIPFMLFTTVILWRYLMKGGISRFGGFILLATYIAFQVLVGISL